MFEQKKGKEIMSNEIIEKLLNNVDSQKVDVIHLPWKIQSTKESAKGQSDSSTQINIRAVTPTKMNGKIKEIPSTDICMEGSKETSRNSSKKGIETKMALCTDIHLEGSTKVNRCARKIDVRTKETLSLDEHVDYGTTEPRNSNHSKELNAEKTKENKWIEVISSHHRRTKQEKIDPGKRQIEIENRYKVLKNL
jgi:hypothetical protein